MRTVVQWREIGSAWRAAAAQVLGSERPGARTAVWGGRVGYSRFESWARPMSRALRGVVRGRFERG
jgi:hypothetical protein